jgi:hypothetical protein
MKRFFRNNGLSLVFFLLFLVSIVGQVITGLNEHNQEMKDEGGKQVSVGEYLTSGHFIESTFENWESEFLQMAVFVVLTISLFQKGSSESKDPEAEEQEEVDKPIDRNRKDAPWPVHKGGLALAVYKHSLSITLFILFLLSFVLHFYGSLKEYNQEQLLKGKATESAGAYMGNSRFWFESFQNWQSEFLSIFAIIMLSIFLRQKGSPQSKRVDAPDSETGE